MVSSMSTPVLKVFFSAYQSLLENKITIMITALEYKKRNIGRIEWKCMFELEDFSSKFINFILFYY